MKKDFRLWHSHKQRIQDGNPRLLFHEREIWFCYLGQNVGFEQDGRGEQFLRPVIILRKFNNEVFWALPLTKAHGHRVRPDALYFTFSFVPHVESAAILSQIRLLDAKRLKYKSGYMPKIEFASLKKKIRQLLA